MPWLTIAYYALDLVLKLVGMERKNPLAGYVQAGVKAQERVDTGAVLDVVVAEKNVTTKSRDETLDALKKGTF